MAEIARLRGELAGSNERQEKSWFQLVPSFGATTGATLAIVGR